MSTFTLTVNIASADINALKQAGYNLCIAKKVNTTYNTVWRGGRSGSRILLTVRCGH